MNTNGPIAKKLVGIIKTNENVNYKDILTEALMDKYHLSEMLNSVNEKNIHGEVETTDPIGKEIW
jgi:antitoxin component of MazEF toxin-antitoxin module